MTDRAETPAKGCTGRFRDGASTLAVEVVSPEDRATEPHAKLHDHLEAGTRDVWILWPRHRSVAVLPSVGSIQERGPDDEWYGGDVLPGFRQQAKAQTCSARALIARSAERAITTE